MSLTDIDPRNLSGLDDEALLAIANEVLSRQEDDRKQNQILYYVPASDGVDTIHRSKARMIGVGGGNRSSKTESMLVEEIALATGVLPLRYREVFKEKFRGPLNVRICIENFITHLHPIILPKLR